MSRFYLDQGKFCPALFEREMRVPLIDSGSEKFNAERGEICHLEASNGIPIAFLYLPSEIGQMRLVYDATGRKWFKYGEFGTTSYASGIEYLDGKLEAIYAPDGRMVAEYTGGQITRYRAEYFHQDHLGNTRLVFSDFNQNGIVDLEEDDPATPLNELEITQESHYYPFGMNHLGPWYETVAPENKYLYNGKELSADYEINLYEYGARWYDPAVGRFTGVDPIAEEFPWVSTYNYAENEPVANIDLHGLQKVLAITQIGINSSGKNFVIQSSTIPKPSEGNYNHLYSVYANPTKYGDKGRLEVLHNVDRGIVIEKYTADKGFLDYFKDLFDGQANGGIQFSLSFGKGEETRSSEFAEVGESLDELLSAFGVTASTANMPPKNKVEDIIRLIFNTYSNANEVVGAMNNKSSDPSTREPVDSICNSCSGPPHDGLPYRTIDRDGNPIDTID